VPATGTQCAILVPAVPGKVPDIFNVFASNPTSYTFVGDVVIFGATNAVITAGAFVSADQVYPIYRIKQPATATLSMSVVPPALGAGVTLFPDNVGVGTGPADLTQSLPAGVAILVSTTGTTSANVLAAETRVGAALNIRALAVQE